MSDEINHPAHYNICGVESINIVENYDFNLGNALKYMYRGGSKIEKGSNESKMLIKDLRKSEFYIKRAIKRAETTSVFNVPYSDKLSQDIDIVVNYKEERPYPLNLIGEAFHLVAYCVWSGSYIRDLERAKSYINQFIEKYEE